MSKIVTNEEALAIKDEQMAAMAAEQEQKNPTPKPPPALNWGPFKELKGLDVTRAHLIHGCEIPGCSVEVSLQTTEANPQSKTRGISMKLTTLGLACQITPRNKPTSFFMVPTSNVKLLNFK